MKYHPENNGHKIITPNSEEVLKAAEKAIRHERIKMLTGKLDKGLLWMTASYGMTPAMYAELQEKEK